MKKILLLVLLLGFAFPTFAGGNRPPNDVSPLFFFNQLGFHTTYEAAAEVWQDDKIRTFITEDEKTHTLIIEDEKMRDFILSVWRKQVFGY